MDETAIDREAMGRLAKALTFIRGAEDPTVIALRQAAERGFSQDIKSARTLFMRLKPGDRQAAMSMLDDEE